MTDKGVVVCSAMATFFAPSAPDDSVDPINPVSGSPYEDIYKLHGALGADLLFDAHTKALERDLGDEEALGFVAAYGDFASSKDYTPGEAKTASEQQQWYNEEVKKSRTVEKLTGGDTASKKAALEASGFGIDHLLVAGVPEEDAVNIVASNAALLLLTGVTAEQRSAAANHGGDLNPLMRGQINARFDKDNQWAEGEFDTKLNGHLKPLVRKFDIDKAVAANLGPVDFMSYDSSLIDSKLLAGGVISDGKDSLKLEEQELVGVRSKIAKLSGDPERKEAGLIARKIISRETLKLGLSDINKSGSYGSMDEAMTAILNFTTKGGTETTGPNYERRRKLFPYALATIVGEVKNTHGVGVELSKAVGGLFAATGKAGRLSELATLRDFISGSGPGSNIVAAPGDTNYNVESARKTAKLIGETPMGFQSISSGLFTGVNAVAAASTSGEFRKLNKEERARLELVADTMEIAMEAEAMASTGASKFVPSDWVAGSSADTWWGGGVNSVGRVAEQVVGLGLPSVGYMVPAVLSGLGGGAGIALFGNFFVGMNVDDILSRSVAAKATGQAGLSSEEVLDMSMIAGATDFVTDRIGLKLASKIAGPLSTLLGPRVMRVFDTPALKNTLGKISGDAAKTVLEKQLQQTSRGALGALGRGAAVWGTETAQELFQDATREAAYRAYVSLDPGTEHMRAIFEGASFKKAWDSLPETAMATFLFGSLAGSKVVFDNRKARIDVGRELANSDRAMVAFGLSKEQADKIAAMKDPEARIKEAYRLSKGLAVGVKVENAMAGAASIELKLKEAVEVAERYAGYTKLTPQPDPNKPGFFTINGKVGLTEEEASAEARILTEEEAIRSAAFVSGVADINANKQAEVRDSAGIVTNDRILDGGIQIPSRESLLAAGYSASDAQAMIDFAMDNKKRQEFEEEAARAKATKDTATAEKPVVVDPPATKEELEAAGVSKRDAIRLSGMQTRSEQAAALQANVDSAEVMAFGPKDKTRGEFLRPFFNLAKKFPGLKLGVAGGELFLRDLVASGSVTLKDALAYLSIKEIQAGRPALNAIYVDSSLSALMENTRASKLLNTTKILGRSMNHEAHFVGGILKGALMFAADANSDTIIEEFSETWLAAALKVGDALGKGDPKSRAYIRNAGLGDLSNAIAFNRTELGLELQRIQTVLGVNLVSKDRKVWRNSKEHNSELLEGFSKLAKIYNKTNLSGLNNGSKTWEVIQAGLEYIATMVSTAIKIGIKLRSQSDNPAVAALINEVSGGKISERLLNALNTAVGVDVFGKMAAENARADYESEQNNVEGVFGKMPTLADVVLKARLIPHLSDLEGDPLRGEVARLTEPYKRGRKGADGKTVWRNYFSSSKLFAKRGSGATLDDARRYLEQRGFNFNTPAEMLEAIESAMNGNDIYPTSAPSGEFGDAFSSEYARPYDADYDTEFKLWNAEFIKGDEDTLFGSKPKKKKKESQKSRRFTEQPVDERERPVFSHTYATGIEFLAQTRLLFKNALLNPEAKPYDQIRVKVQPGVLKSIWGGELSANPYLELDRAAFRDLVGGGYGGKENVRSLDFQDVISMHRILTGGDIADSVSFVMTTAGWEQTGGGSWIPSSADAILDQAAQDVVDNQSVRINAAGKYLEADLRAGLSRSDDLKDIHRYSFDTAQSLFDSMDARKVSNRYKGIDSKRPPSYSLVATFRRLTNRMAAKVLFQSKKYGIKDEVGKNERRSATYVEDKYTVDGVLSAFDGIMSRFRDANRVGSIRKAFDASIGKLGSVGNPGLGIPTLNPLDGIHPDDVYIFQRRCLDYQSELEARLEAQGLVGGTSNVTKEEIPLVSLLMARWDYGNGMPQINGVEKSYRAKSAVDATAVDGEPDLQAQHGAMVDDTRSPDNGPDPLSSFEEEEAGPRAREYARNQMGEMITVDGMSVVLGDDLYPDREPDIVATAEQRAAVKNSMQFWFDSLGWGRTKGEQFARSAGTSDSALNWLVAMPDLGAITEEEAIARIEARRKIHGVSRTKFKETDEMGIAAYELTGRELLEAFQYNDGKYYDGVDSLRAMLDAYSALTMRIPTADAGKVLYLAKHSLEQVYNDPNYTNFGVNFGTIARMRQTRPDSSGKTQTPTFGHARTKRVVDDYNFFSRVGCYVKREYFDSAIEQGKDADGRFAGFYRTKYKTVGDKRVVEQGPRPDVDLIVRWYSDWITSNPYASDSKAAVAMWNRWHHKNSFASHKASWLLKAIAGSVRMEDNKAAIAALEELINGSQVPSKIYDGVKVNKDGSTEGVLREFDDKNNSYLSRWFNLEGAFDPTGGIGTLLRNGAEGDALQALLFRVVSGDYKLTYEEADQLARAADSIGNRQEATPAEVSGVEDTGFADSFSSDPGDYAQTQLEQDLPGAESGLAPDKFLLWAQGITRMSSRIATLTGKYKSTKTPDAAKNGIRVDLIRSVNLLSYSLPQLHRVGKLSENADILEIDAHFNKVKALLDTHAVGETRSRILKSLRSSNRSEQERALLRTFFEKFANMPLDGDIGDTVEAALSKAAESKSNPDAELELEAFRRFRGFNASDADPARLLDTYTWVSGLETSERTERDKAQAAYKEDRRKLKAILIGSFTGTNKRKWELANMKKGGLAEWFVSSTVGPGNIASLLERLGTEFNVDDMVVLSGRIQEEFAEAEVRIAEFNLEFAKIQRKYDKALNTGRFGFAVYESEVVATPVRALSRKTRVVDANGVESFENNSTRKQVTIPLALAEAIFRNAPGWRDMANANNYVITDAAVEALRREYSRKLNTDAQMEADLRAGSATASFSWEFTAFADSNTKEEIGNEANKDGVLSKVKAPSWSGKRLTKGQALQLLLSMESSPEMAEAMGYTAETKADLVAALDPEYIAYGYELRDFYNANVAPLSTQDTALFTGAWAPLNNTYWPSITANAITRTNDGAYDPGVAISVDERPSLQTLGGDADFDLSHSATAVIRRQTQFALKRHYAENKTIRQLNAVLNDETVVEALSSVSPAFYKTLRNRVASVYTESHMAREKDTVLNAFAVKLIRQSQLVLLMFKVSTALRQLPAVMNLMTHDFKFSDLFNLFSNDGGLAAGEVNGLNMMKVRFVTDYERVWGPEDHTPHVAGSWYTVAGSTGAAANAIGKFGMAATVGYIDAAAMKPMARAKWRSYYKKGLKKFDGDHEQAAQYAGEKLSHLLSVTAQPMTSAAKTTMMDSASRNLLAAIVLMLKTEVMKTGSLIYFAGYDIVSGRNKARGATDLAMISIQLILLQGLINCIIRAGRDDDKEFAEYLRKFHDADGDIDWQKLATFYAADGFMNMASGFPIFGDAFSATVGELSGNRSYASRSAITSTFLQIKEITKSMAGIESNNNELSMEEMSGLNKTDKFTQLTSAVSLFVGGIFGGATAITTPVAALSNLTNSGSSVVRAAQRLPMLFGGESLTSRNKAEEAKLLGYKVGVLKSDYTDRLAALQMDEKANRKQIKSLEEERDSRVGALVSKNYLNWDEDYSLEVIASIHSTGRVTAEHLKKAGLGPKKIAEIKKRSAVLKAERKLKRVEKAAPKVKEAEERRAAKSEE